MSDPTQEQTVKDLPSDLEVLIEESREAEKKALATLDLIAKQPGVDPRCVSLAKTNIEQGFMWLNRAVAKP
jgi:hypothetical protein